jgi:hypothetical protein
VWIVVVADEEAVPRFALGPQTDDAAHRLRDTLRLPRGYRADVVKLREPDAVDVETQALDRRGGG